MIAATTVCSSEKGNNSITNELAKNSKEKLKDYKVEIVFIVGSMGSRNVLRNDGHLLPGLMLVRGDNLAFFLGPPFEAMCSESLHFFNLNISSLLFLSFLCILSDVPEGTLSLYLTHMVRRAQDEGLHLKFRHLHCTGTSLS